MKTKNQTDNASHRAKSARALARQMRHAALIAAAISYPFLPTTATAQSPLESRRSALANPHFFQGARYDAETGFYYFRNRFYDPQAGRFLQRDPVWDEQNVGGWFTFTGNNALSRRDPLGMDGSDFDRFELEARLTTLDQAMKRLKELGDPAQAAAVRKAKNRLLAYCMQFPDEPAIKNAQTKVKLAETAIDSAKAKSAAAAATAGTPDCPPSAAPEVAPTPESEPSLDRWNQFAETITRYVQHQKKRFEKEPGEELTKAEQKELRRLDQLSEAAEMVRAYQTGELACEDPKARSSMLIAMTRLTRFFGGEPEEKEPEFDKVEMEIKEALKSSKVTPSMFRLWFRTFEQERKTLLKSND